jgi:hypothetical protein
MTLQAEIQAFVARRTHGPVCDDCIADHLALSRRQVGGAAMRFKQGGAMRRFKGQCSGCCTNRRVTVLT